MLTRRRFCDLIPVNDPMLIDQRIIDKDVPDVPVYRSVLPFPRIGRKEFCIIVLSAGYRFSQDLPLFKVNTEFQRRPSRIFIPDRKEGRLRRRIHGDLISVSCLNDVSLFIRFRTVIDFVISGIQILYFAPAAERIAFPGHAAVAGHCDFFACLFAYCCRERTAFTAVGIKDNGCIVAPDGIICRIIHREVILRTNLIMYIRTALVSRPAQQDMSVLIVRHRSDPCTFIRFGRSDIGCLEPGHRRRHLQSGKPRIYECDRRTPDRIKSRLFRRYNIS